MPPVMGRFARLKGRLNASLKALYCWVLLTLPGAATAAILEVQVESGWLRGGVAAGIASFKGIPYAAPPVADLRWRSPQPAPPWQGMRDATVFGDQCLQLPYPEDSPYLQAPAPASEDCLTLNIWSPDLSPERALPVMVWLHGGNFTRGSGSLPVYDGTALAARGVLVVTFNYRLNVFGYLAHPLLSREQGGYSGNYGLQDQLAALRWVKDNISAFGGDPNAITLFGESAGSSAINQLLALPQARGLVHRAIGQSGGFLLPQPTLEDAHRSGEQLLNAPDSAASMRALDARELLSRLAAFEAGGGRVGPMVDGRLLRAQLTDLYASGDMLPVPALLGYNRDEATSFARYPDIPGLFRTQTEFEEGLLAHAGVAAWPLIWAYPERPGSRQPYLDFWRDAVFGWNMQTWAELNEEAGQSAWLYFFTHAPATDWGERLGAFHAAEIPYVFGNQVPDRAEDRAVHQLLQTYWVNFARTGNPNGSGAPNWPRFGSDGRYLELKAEPQAAEDLSWIQMRLLGLLNRLGAK